jgi:hypothetical protein
MSMKTANNIRTLCEVLREINDIMQGNPLQPIVFKKLE